MKKFHYDAEAMKGKTVIITGASDGIGAAAARALHELEANVVIVGRSPEKTKKIGNELGVPYYVADFSKFEDVRNLAAQIKKDHSHIDILINNAGGVMGTHRELTVDGNEMTIQVDHLSPFLLTHLLMDTLIASGATIINTASTANRFSGTLDLDDMKLEHGYSRFSAYGKAKLMNILFTKELVVRFGEKGFHAASFHPGVVATNFSASSGGLVRFIYKSFLNRILLSPAEGADTLVWLAASKPGVDWVSGEYYAKRKIYKAKSDAYNAKLAHDLWEKSLKIITATPI
jgi:NAD(P)-dependent dehydrogenase (short-subunit alcohol dehydrogenase family)